MLDFKCVSTWSFYPWLNSRGSFWQQISRMLASAKASIELVERHYSRPAVYTDSLGKYIFSKFTDKADFIVCYDDLNNELPSSLWAGTKLLTYSKQNSPFFHFDLDFLCFNKFHDSVFDCDVMVQGFEDLKNDKFRKEILIYYNAENLKSKYNLPDIFSEKDINKIPAVNMGCIFFNDMHLHKLYVDAVFHIIENNKQQFNVTPSLHMCAVEQHTLGILIEKTKAKCNTLIDSGWGVYPGNNDFFHFCGSYYKSHPDFSHERERMLSPWLDKDTIELAQELLSIRNEIKLAPSRLKEWANWK